MTARTDLFVRQLALFELHVNAAASGVHSNAVLCGGNADYHTGLIRHDGPTSTSAKSHAPRSRGTHVIMTVEILKMLQVKNLTISGRVGHPDLAYRQPFDFNRIVFASVGQRA